jgi:iron complex transport system ATP-binding protein
MHVLAAKELTVAYQETVVLSELDLTIPVGKITALVGSNGCGKSTLLRTLARLLKPTSGGVFLDQQAIHTRSTREVARRLGILPQAPVAPEGLTVRDLVAQGRYPRQRWFRSWSAADEQMVAQALRATGMSDLAERPMEALSGGQRQRAWIAMALAQETEILLLDEPTTYLDMAHQIELLDLLYELNQTEGRTIVMVLHDLNQACRYAHHLVAIKDGRVFAEGDPAQVVTQEMVKAVFGLDCCIVKDPVSATPLCVPIGCYRCIVKG